MKISHVIATVFLTVGVVSPAIGETDGSSSAQKSMSGAPCMHKQGMMMEGKQRGGMPMMHMMEERQTMMDAHMKKMETHMENIEALLRQLVELQKK